MSTSAFSSSNDFNAEKMMSDLEKKLRLSSEKFEEMKPDLEKTLQKKSKDLKSSINEQVEKGFVELESMSKKLDKASVEAKSNIEKALNSDQVKELKSFLAGIDEEAIKEAQEKLLDDLTKQLELTADQLEKLKPILRDYMVQASELLKQVSKEGSNAFDKYRDESEVLAKDMKSRLQKALDSEQMKKLEKQLKDVSDKIKEKVFAEGK
ncbi:MAG: hypothetical protein U9N50_05025 [Pseudomonadota bacterium]|nr:hypothetical protein [Pseudomonadota bacterium]